MSLSNADVQEIMRLVEQSSFDELVIEMGGIKLQLRRGAGSAASRSESKPVAALPVAAPAAVSATRKQPELPTSAPQASGQSVTSPMLGTFYRSPKPGAPPYVEVGSSVEEDTIIGIIEVMKLMNTVRAGIKGRVTSILKGDGVLVEFGEALIRIEPSV